MTDAETKVRDLLSELVAQVSAGAELERPTLRRARRRRIGGALVSLVIIVGLALGGFEVFRAVQAPTAPLGEGTTSPSPVQEQPFAGLWPETDADALATAQAAADEGHQPWRLDPAQTAEALAVDFFGWPEDEASRSLEELHVKGSTAHVSLVDPMFGDPVPPIAIQLRQLGATGPNGIWGVTSVRSPLIELDPITGGEGTITVSGTLADSLFDQARIGPSWAPKEVEVSFITGPTFDSSVGGGTLPVDRSFSGTWPGPVDPDHALEVWVRVLDAQGRALGATAVRVGTVTITVQPPRSGSTPAPQALPDAVAATRASIYDASVRGDFEALRSLIDPDHFSYNFSDGHDPIPEWKQRPQILGTLVRILDMPFSVRHSDTGEVYSWPYFTDADLTTLTQADYDLLATLGITRTNVEGMIAFGGYTGPRLGIAEDGRWLYYTEGGD